MNGRGEKGNDEKRSLALDLNLHRRHLDSSERKKIVAELRKQGMTTTAIGDKLGVDEGTVRNDLKAVSENSETQFPARVIGKDGKSYPARKKKPVRAEGG